MVKKTKTVIILPNWVGDFLMAFASLDPVMEKNRLLLMGKRRFWELIRGKYPYSIWIEKHEGFKGFLKNIINLMRSEASVAVLLPNSFSSALTATLSGMSKIIGIPSDGRFFLLTHKVKINSFLHQAEIYRKILEAAGLKFEGTLSANLYLSEDDEIWAKERLKKLGWEREKIFVVHPGASKKERCWPIERFSEIATLTQKKGYKILIVGSKRENHLARTIKEKIKNKEVFDLTELDLSLGKLAAFIKQGDVFLGNDSGPLHIAAASGLKCVGIYGPGSPKKTGPILSKTATFKYVSLEMNCSPCKERFFKDCKPIEEKPPCIWNISTEMVWERLKEFL